MEAPTCDVSASPLESPPDWSTIGEDVACPLCEYNLRGLVEPRCPECGYRFTWPEMLDPKRRLHSYLFEHHPEHNFWSFRKTFFGTLRPGRFWRSLHPIQPSRPHRIVRYWAVFAVCFFLFLIFNGAVQVWAVRYINLQGKARNRVWISSDPSRMQSLADHYGSVENYLESVCPTRPAYLLRFGMEQIARFSPLVIAIVALPWITILSLLVFQFSMRRARVRPAHVVRAVVYSQSATLASALVVQVLGASVILFGAAWLTYLMVFNVLAVILLFYGLLTGAYGLIVAYREYLRFDRPDWTVLAGYLIVALVYLNLGYAHYILTSPVG